MTAALASSPPSPADVWVRFLATVGPTSTDRTRYEAGSVWAVSRARADALSAEGLAVLVQPPASALRIPTEPLEPPTADAAAIPAISADEEE